MPYKTKKVEGGGTREINNPKYIDLCEFKFKQTHKICIFYNIKELLFSVLYDYSYFRGFLH